MAGRSNDDAVSEFGDDNMFVGAPAVRASNDNVGQQQSSKSQTHSSSLPTKGLMREDPRVSTGWGRGPIPVDSRKIRFDVTRARQSPALSFSATKVDRMDPSLAGDYLERLLKMYGIDREEENRILAFTNALWFEHTVNGASMLQPGRGFLYVDGVSFDIQPIKVMLGVDMRRFFRAFADEIASANQDVIDAYDAYVPELAEKHGQLMQVATERGLHKYPHLAHDSSDACLTLSHEERLAVINSKRVVLPSVVNKVDVIPGRVGSNKGTATEQQVPAGAAGMNN